MSDEIMDIEIHENFGGNPCYLVCGYGLDWIGDSRSGPRTLGTVTVTLKLFQSKSP